MADDLARHAPGGPVRRAARGHAWDRPGDRGNDGGDDGHRKRAPDPLGRAFLPRAHDDRHDRGGDGRGSRRQHPLPYAVPGGDHPVPDLVPGEYHRLLDALPRQEARRTDAFLMHPSRIVTQRIAFGLLTAIMTVTVLAILAIITYIFWNGLPTLSWEFLSSMPSNGMREGGIWPAIIGTLFLTIGTAVVAVPIGLLAEISLSEYAPDSTFTRTIRIAIVNLAGIPAVGYGLFGLALVVLFLQLGSSILASCLTLAIMTLPVIISTAEEALRAGPQSFRGVSISMGGTRWQTIRRIVLPQALPGLLTGVILGLERAAGATAPILF